MPGEHAAQDSKCGLSQGSALPDAALNGVVVALNGVVVALDSGHVVSVVLFVGLLFLLLLLLLYVV